MKKLLIFILGAGLGIAGFIFVIHSFYNIHITAVFEELEPFPRNLNVYYKGFKLGRSVRVRPSKDFTNTRVDMILNAKGISLPDNITAKVKRKDKKDYIELEYPDAPSITDIKNHSVIQGKKSFDISGYIDEQAEGGGLEAGTLNGHGIAGLHAALGYLEKTGIDNIRKKEENLMWRFYNGVKDVPGVKIYGDYSQKERCAIVTLNIGDYDSSEVSDELLMEYDISTRSGGHCAPLMHEALGTVEQGAVRFSFSHYNTEEEVDTAIRAIRELAEEP